MVSLLQTLLVFFALGFCQSFAHVTHNSTSGGLAHILYGYPYPYYGRLYNTLFMGSGYPPNNRWMPNVGAQGPSLGAMGRYVFPYLIPLSANHLYHIPYPPMSNAWGNNNRQNYQPGTMSPPPTYPSGQNFEGVYNQAPQMGQSQSTVRYHSYSVGLPLISTYGILYPRQGQLFFSNNVPQSNSGMSGAGGYDRYQQSGSSVNTMYPRRKPSPGNGIGSTGGLGAFILIPQINNLPSGTNNPSVSGNLGQNGFVGSAGSQQPRSETNRFSYGTNQFGAYGNFGFNRNAGFAASQQSRPDNRFFYVFNQHSRNGNMGLNIPGGESSNMGYNPSVISGGRSYGCYGGNCAFYPIGFYIFPLSFRPTTQYPSFPSNSGGLYSATGSNNYGPQYPSGPSTNPEGTNHYNNANLATNNPLMPGVFPRLQYPVVYIGWGLNGRPGAQGTNQPTSDTRYPRPQQTSVNNQPLGLGSVYGGNTAHGNTE